jgi:hypothetical protein
MDFTIQLVLMVIGVAVVIWFLADRFLAWAVPSSEWGALVPALAGAFVGVLWSWQIVDAPTPQSNLLGAIIGCVVVLYLAITISTPGSAGAVINCVAAGPLETGLKSKAPGPWAWPYQLVVANRGSVVWHVHADQALTVTIRFPDGSPFEQTMFSGQIGAGMDGAIVAAPVVRSGRFTYEITGVDAGGNVFTADPKVAIPRR